MTFTAQRYRFMRSIGSLGSATAMLVMAGCKDLDVPNLNGASADGLTSNPTPTQLITSAQSMVTSWRSTDAGHAGSLTYYGYEYWSFRSSEPRGLTNVVATPLTGGFWSYGVIKNIDILLTALQTVPGMTDAEKTGLRAWLKMNRAVQLEDMVQAHDSFGVVLTLAADPLSGAPAPINTKAEVWAEIFKEMDDSYADLANAGTAFDFKLGSGWAGYNTPATMRPLNRALKARWLDTYAVPLGRPGYSVAGWDNVLTALAGTWINPVDGTPFVPGTTTPLTAAQLRVGPFHTYEATSTNGLNTIDRYSNTRYLVEAQCKTAGAIPGGHTCANDSTAFNAGGSAITYTPTNRDGRAFGAQARVLQLTPTKSDNLLLYGTVPVIRILEQTDILNPSQSARISTTSPLPIIRNEELLLIRAEAYMNKGDCVSAVADLNRVRTSAIANLPAITCPYAGDPSLNQPASLEDELLYERRFSLWGETGTVWLDMRHYGKSNLIPHWDPSFRIFDIIPIPNTECDVRGYTVKGCFSTGYAGIQGGPNTFFQPLQ